MSLAGPLRSAAFVLPLGLVLAASASAETDPDVEQRLRELEGRQAELEAHEQELEEELREERRELERLRAIFEDDPPAPEQEPEKTPPAGVVIHKGPSVFTNPGHWKTRGDFQMTQIDLPEALSVGLGVQYRVMYNASNLPGPGSSTITDPRDYDFARQRFRINFGIAPKGQRLGGAAQIQFQGGFGGSSPGASDPRGVPPTVNGFNFIRAQGLRWGYIFAEPWEGQRFLGGIIPMSDEVGDTLFSADWDWQMGGGAFLGSSGDTSYRLAYWLAIDGVGSVNPNQIDRDGEMILADLVHDFGDFRLGGHVYWLWVDQGLTTLGKTDEGWIALTGATKLGPVDLNAFGMVNTGTLGPGVSGTGRKGGHTGYAAKLEGKYDFQLAKIELQFLYASGDEAGEVENQFVTPQRLFGTSGYWAYTHLFTANGPSDVNDLALELSNGGAGLMTVQGRFSKPVFDWLWLEAFGGYFRAAEARGTGKDLGGELGGMATFFYTPALRLDVGATRGFMGDFYGPGQDDLWEVFTRFQLQF